MRHPEEITAAEGTELRPQAAEGDRKPRKKFKWKVDYFGIVFIIPFFAVYAIFSLYPMIYSIVLSITDYEGYNRVISLIGFENFVWLATQLRFWQSLLNTVMIFAMNFVPQMLFALIFAAMFTGKTYKMRGKGAFKAIYYLPNILTATSVAIMFYTLFARPSGGLWQLLTKLGMSEEVNLYLMPWPSRIIIAFIQFWMWFGNSMITLSAGILGINPSVFEAAQLDGASQKDIFLHITLPLIKPIVVYSLVVSTLGGLQVFDIPYLFLSGGPVMTGGRNATETVAVYIYKMAFTGEMRYNVASAASVYLFVICMLVSFVLFRVTHSDELKQQKRLERKLRQRGVMAE
mgnify:FL=1